MMLRCSFLCFGTIILAFILPSCEAFGVINRRESFLGIASSCIGFPLVSLAEPIPDTAPLDFSGVYRDPKHPQGYRIVRTFGTGRITVAVNDDSDGPTVQLLGTRDYDPTTKKTRLDIQVPGKGGPGYVLPATYLPDQLLYVNFCGSGEVLTRGSITFPDGNIWVKENGIQGVYVDSRVADGFRIIRELGNAKVAIDVANRADQVPTSLSAVINKSEGTLVIDFSPLSGPKRMSAEIAGSQLIFQDGSTWTKL